MNSLYYVSKFPKLSESFILNEVRELDDRGHNVAISASKPSDDTVVHQEYEELEVPVNYRGTITYGDVLELRSLTPSPWVLAKTISHTSPIRHAIHLVTAKRCIEFCEGLSYELDHIHAHFASLSRYPALYVADHFDIPITVTAHAYELFRNPTVRRLQHICRSVDHIVVPSQYNRRYMREKLGVTSDITVVPATTRVEKFQPRHPDVRNRILTVGRLVEKKGHIFAIDAVADLINRGFDVAYHIVGSGERENRLRSRVREHGIAGHVTFLGHVTDERLQRELSEAAVFLLPCLIAEDGDRDAMPVVLKEAMAAETACISTTVSAIPELITHRENGLLVPPRDVNALADAVESLLTDDRFRTRLSQQGSQTVHEKFDIAQAVDRLERVFLEMTNEGSEVKAPPVATPP